MLEIWWFQKNKVKNWEYATNIGLVRFDIKSFLGSVGFGLCIVDFRLHLVD